MEDVFAVRPHCSSVLVALLEELYCDDVVLMTVCVILREQRGAPLEE